MASNLQRLVSVGVAAFRVAERAAVGAVLTYFAQGAAPSLFAGNAGAWKTVLVAAGFAALHAEAKTATDKLQAWASKFLASAPAAPSAASSPPNGGGNSSAS